MPTCYGRALYYPYLTFHDDLWLRSAALYYDGINRIVPNGVVPDDSESAKVLMGEVGFIENLDPSQEAEEIQARFLQIESGYKALSNPTNLNWFRIHRKKMSFLVLVLLAKKRLARRVPDDVPRADEWIDVETTTAALYMTSPCIGIAMIA
jgi:hypothetical protein